MSSVDRWISIAEKVYENADGAIRVPVGAPDRQALEGQ